MAPPRRARRGASTKASRRQAPGRCPHAPKPARLPRPFVGRLGRPQGLADQRGRAAAPAWSRGTDLLDVGAQNADLAEQLCQADIADGRARQVRARVRDSTAQDGSSIALSRPGSTTAPFGSRAIAASSSAVAGIEPVEPAAITGPVGGFAPSRSASSRISALRCAAGLDWPRPASKSGQCSVTMTGNRASPATSRQVRRRQRRQPRPVRSLGLDLVHQRGEVARQPDRIGGGRRHHHLLVEQRGDMRRQPFLPGAHQRRQMQQAVDGGNRRREIERAGARAPKAASSSSNSPSGRTVGRIAERPAACSTKTARSSRAARRVGT